MPGSRPASAASKAPALLPMGHHTGKPPIPLHRPVTVIGSRSNARIHLTSSSVSKAHALVVRDGSVTYIRDLASRSKVFIDGEEVREHDLADGELIKIGSFTFKFVEGKGRRAEQPGKSEAPKEPPPGQLEVSGAEYPVPIDQRVLLIGRRPICDVHLLEATASTAHAVVFQMNGAHHVRDLGSRTGTYVNGVAVHQHQLNAGDVIRIGETTLTYTPGVQQITAGATDSAAGEDLEIFDDTPGGQARPAHVGADDHDLVDLSPHAAQGGTAVPGVSTSEPDLPDIDDLLAEDSKAGAEPRPEPDELLASLDDEKAGSAAAAPTGPTTDASAEKADSAVPLSEADEKSSAARGKSETAHRSVRGGVRGSLRGRSPADTEFDVSAPTNESSSQDSVGGGADLLPRRGWRATPTPATEGSAEGSAAPIPVEDEKVEPEQVEAEAREAEPEATGPDRETIEPVAEVPAEAPAKPAAVPQSEQAPEPQPQPEPQGSNEPQVLRLDEPSSSADAAVLDDEAPADALDFTADVAEPRAPRGDTVTAGKFAESTDEELPLLGIEPDEPSQPSQPRAAAAPREPLQIDLSSAADVGAPEATIDLRGLEEPGEAITDEASTANEADATKREQPLLRLDAGVSAPAGADDIAINPDALLSEPGQAPEKPAETTKPRGRRGAKKAAAAASETTERVAASRTRRKPKQPVVEQADEKAVEPVEPVAELPAPTPTADEVIAPSEPTPESALDLEGATYDASVVDEAAISEALSEPTVSDPLTDTGLNRAVHDLTGDAGEIVEAPEARTAPDVPAAADAKVEPPPVEKPATAPVADARAPHPLGPSYSWGANQENFLGGVPVVLPPLRPPPSPFGQSEIKLTEAPPAPPAPPVPPEEPKAQAPVAEPAPSTDEPAKQDVLELTDDDIVAALEDAPKSSPAPANEASATPVAARPDPVAEPPKRADATEQFEAVNALIDEILSPVAGDEATDEKPAPTNEVPAQPQTPPPASPPAPPPPAPVINEPTQSRPVIPIPPPPAARKFGRGARRDRNAAAAAASAPAEGFGAARTARTTESRPLRDDERIPPYTGPGPATRGGVTVGFDGLAMPPVRETDVFAHMSPPAPADESAEAVGAGAATAPDGLTAARSSGDTMLDPFGGAVGAVGAGAMTPMDLVGTETAPPRPRRAPGGGGRFGDLPSRGGESFNTPKDRGAASTPFPGADAPAPAAEAPRRRTIRPAVPLAPGAPRDVAPPVPTDAPNHELPPGESSELLSDEQLTGADEDEQPKRRPPVVYSPSTSPETPDVVTSKARKRHFRRVAILLVLMVIGAAGAGFAAWNFVPVRTGLEASVTFRNLAALQTFDRKQVQDQQRTLLLADLTRRSAIRWLRENEPEVTTGFLDDVQQYTATVTWPNAWPESRKNVLVMHRESTEADTAGDRARLHAIAEALIAQNADTLGKQARDAQRAYEKLKNDVADYEQKLAQLNEEEKRLQLMGNSAPDKSAIDKITLEVQALDKEWGDAVAKVKACEAELAQLKAAAPASGGGGASEAGAPEPSVGETAMLAANDQPLAQMRANLKQLTEKMDAAQAQRAEQAAAARRTLDAAMDQFEKQIASARQVMNGSPELAAYVTAAQKLQQDTRSLLDDLIRRQEQSYGRLTDITTKLVEKAEQRRQQQIQQDPKLRELNERRAIAERQYNAAVAGGMKKESDDKKAELDLLDSMIRAQQDLLPKDADNAATIEQLQQFADATRKDIEDARKRTDAMLEEWQKTFVNSQSVEKMPEAQKQVAAGMEKRLSDINAARAKYNEVMSAAGAAADDDSTRGLRQQIASLTASIETRQKELNDATSKAQQALAARGREEAVAQKETELASLKEAENNARQAYQNKEKELRDQQATAEGARASADQLIEVQRKKQGIERVLPDLKLNEPRLKKAADEAVEPMPFKPEYDVAKVGGSDNSRQIWTVASAGAVFVIFAGLILLTLHGAARELSVVDLETSLPPRAPAVMISDAADPDETAPAGDFDDDELASAGSNGTPHPSPATSNGQGGHDDDESAPAVL